MTTEEANRKLAAEFSKEQILFLLDKSTPEFRAILEAELRKREAAKQ
jgi:hypothetical protein